jgi:hypothetical protein
MVITVLEALGNTAAATQHNACVGNTYASMVMQSHTSIARRYGIVWLCSNLTTLEGSTER